MFLLRCSFRDKACHSKRDLRLCNVFSAFVGRAALYWRRAVVPETKQKSIKKVLFCWSFLMCCVVLQVHFGQFDLPFLPMKKSNYVKVELRHPFPHTQIQTCFEKKSNYAKVEFCVRRIVRNGPVSSVCCRTSWISSDLAFQVLSLLNPNCGRRHAGRWNKLPTMRPKEKSEAQTAALKTPSPGE